MASAVVDAAPGRRRALRVAVFLGVLLLVAGGGLVYDYSRAPLYRATSRLAVEPPGGGDAVSKAQFAVSEAQALLRSELTNAAAERSQAAATAGRSQPAAIDYVLSAEPLPQTSTIELRAEGPDAQRLVAVLAAWIDAYTESRKVEDIEDETENVEEARHAVETAKAAIEAKRREIDAFRSQHGIVSIEREENPSANRLKALYSALNEASAREVNAEARLKALNDSVAQGTGAVPTSERSALGNLESRANDLRARMRDLEHDYTQNYLAMDPKYKALRSNLERIEKQIENERQRTQKSALVDAQEQYASAQRAAQKLRDQIDSIKQESQAFSMRFVELKRMASDLDQLQEARRVATTRLAKLETARKPAQVKIRVLTVPEAARETIWPHYTRDAGIALGAGLLLAVLTIWVMDYLRRDPETAEERGQQQPLIQIAYPTIASQAGPAGSIALRQTPSGLLAPVATAQPAGELTAEDVTALWRSATSDVRLILAALFAGIGPDELAQLRWRHIELGAGLVEVPGASARRLHLTESLQGELARKADAIPVDPEAPLLADGAGNPLDEAAIDEQLAFAAHDAAIRHPEEVTGRALHFTYAAFLARQGIRMSDLSAKVGRLSGAIGAELMRLAPPGKVRSADDVDLVYPSFRFG